MASTSSAICPPFRPTFLSLSIPLKLTHPFSSRHHLSVWPPYSCFFAPQADRGILQRPDGPRGSSGALCGVLPQVVCVLKGRSFRCPPLCRRQLNTLVWVRSRALRLSQVDEWIEPLPRVLSCSGMLVMFPKWVSSSILTTQQVWYFVSDAAFLSSSQGSPYSRPDLPRQIRLFGRILKHGRRQTEQRHKELKESLKPGIGQPTCFLFSRPQQNSRYPIFDDRTSVFSKLGRWSSEERPTRTRTIGPINSHGKDGSETTVHNNRARPAITRHLQLAPSKMKQWAKG